MKQKRNILLPALLFPLALAALAPREALSFSPSEGAVLTKSIESDSELSLDDMSMVVGGQEAPADMEMTISIDESIVFTDKYEEVNDGRPVRLVRTFDELAQTTMMSMSHPMMGDQDQELIGASELEGLEVVFTWDAEEGAYDVDFHAGEGDADLLEGLVEDTDFREFLPEGEVEEGAVWEIDPDDMRYLLAPGGALKIEPEEMDMQAFNQPQPDMAQLLGEIDGDVTATYQGMRDEEGTNVAVIELEIDISTANDLTDFMQDAMNDVEVPGGEELDMEVGSYDFEMTYEGEGQLLWNVERGIAHSLNLSGDLSMIHDVVMEIAMQGQTQDIEQSMTMSGSHSLSYAVE